MKLWARQLLVALLVASSLCITVPLAGAVEEDNVSHSSHIIVPPRRSASKAQDDRSLTLRQFLSDKDGFHLALAPAFFGFYGYFGVLASWQESLGKSILTRQSIRSVAGASAGAIAAVLLSEGISPARAVEFCRSLTLERISDFPGALAVFRGHRVEALMQEFLNSERPDSSHMLENGNIPIAVTGFDLVTLKGKTLSMGPMARAARASATFPVLFQPISWSHNGTDYMLIDGGLADTAGLNGLSSFLNVSGRPARVVNVQVGSYWNSPPGPSQLPTQNATVVSVSIQGLPTCSPWALDNGPIAAAAAQRAMTASLDIPLFRGTDSNHYELHIDASKFWK